MPTGKTLFLPVVDECLDHWSNIEGRVLTCAIHVMLCVDHVDETWFVLLSSLKKIQSGEGRKFSLSYHDSLSEWRWRHGSLKFARIRRSWNCLFVFNDEMDERRRIPSSWSSRPRVTISLGNGNGCGRFVRISFATILCSCSHELKDYAQKLLTCEGQEDCSRTGLI